MNILHHRCWLNSRLTVYCNKGNKEENYWTNVQPSCERLDVVNRKISQFRRQMYKFIIYIASVFYSHNRSGQCTQRLSRATIEHSFIHPMRSRLGRVRGKLLSGPSRTVVSTTTRVSWVASPMISGCGGSISEMGYRWCLPIRFTSKQKKPASKVSSAHTSEFFLTDLEPGCKKGGGPWFCPDRLLMWGCWFATTGTVGQLSRRWPRTFASAGSTDLARDPLQHRLIPNSCK